MIEDALAASISAADICAKVTTETATINTTAGKEQKRNIDEMNVVATLIYYSYSEYLTCHQFSFRRRQGSYYSTWNTSHYSPLYERQQPAQTLNNYGSTTHSV